jgi:hypothetical protein
LLLLALLLTACASTSTPARPAQINHLAFFVLQDPDDARELIADCDAMASAIPGIVAYYCGTHLDTGRETVDGDYDVGFYVGFDSVEDLRAYVENPNHLALVTKWRPRLSSLRVHDVLDETR